MMTDDLEAALASYISGHWISGLDINLLNTYIYVSFVHAQKSLDPDTFK